MRASHVRLILLMVDIAAIALITGLFVWSLRGIHRFPVEAAVYVAIVLALLTSNAVYIWRYPPG